MNEYFSFNDMRILDEEIEDHIRGTMSGARILSLLEAEDRLAVEDTFRELQKCEITLDLSDLPKPALSGSSAQRLAQEAELKSLQQLTVELEENDPLQLYLQELAATPAAGDVQLYAERYLSGEHHLAEPMVNLYLSRVVELALEHTGHGVLLLDLVQEGSMGLWECIPEYTGGSFMTHADWWIRHYMARLVILTAHENGLGSLLRRDMEEYIQADKQLLAQLGRNPTQDEIADRLGLELSEVQTLEKMVSEARKFETAKAEPEPEKPEEDADQAVENTAYFQLRQRIAELLSTLSETDAKILTLRFGLEGGKPKTPVETGLIMNMTAAEVVQREAAALESLRSQ